MTGRGHTYIQVRNVRVAGEAYTSSKVDPTGRRHRQSDTLSPRQSPPSDFQVWRCLSWTTRVITLRVARAPQAIIDATIISQMTFLFRLRARSCSFFLPS